MALTSSEAEPVAVRTVARAIADWIHRLGPIWVEGEVAQLTRRPGTGICFLTLRDTQAAVSISVTCPRSVLDAVQPPLTDGARIIVQAKPSFYLPRGTLSLAATSIRPVGLGELLARIEMLRGLLAAEGLFAPERKQPLPFLPRTVGLISGRASAAERDVVENARARWPAVRFAVRSTPVQGASAVPQIVAALEDLQATDGVDVIVIARGGGSVEDLLPFSDETLLRAVAGCTVPVVSAIGHEQDVPLLDHVADVRASTPTDAARRIVPDRAEESARVRRARAAGRDALQRRLAEERRRLREMRERPVLASPANLLIPRREQLARERDRLRGRVGWVLRHERSDLQHRRSVVRLLSPASTLERGYAIVQDDEGHVVRTAGQVRDGQNVTVRLVDGTITARVERSAVEQSPAVGGIAGQEQP